MHRALRYAFFLLTGIAWCQSPPDASLGAALQSLASRAGVVFVGQVVKVEPKPGVVEITFRVDQALQGAVGSTYTLREWAGLWAGGQPRYVPGQRAMLFLHAPSSGGLGTPVDGMDGVVPVVATSSAAPPMLDVRWLATRVQRSVGAPLVQAKVSLDDAVAAVRSGSEPRLFSLPPQPRPQPLTPVRLLPPVGDVPQAAVPDGPQVLLQAVQPDVR